MGKTGLPKDVQKTCPCGVEFVTTKRNVLGLCPMCVLEREGVRAREKRAMRVPGTHAVRAVVVAVDDDYIPPNREFRREQSGPEYGFASLGDLYRANDGRLVGKRIRMDLMSMPAAIRPRNVLEVWG
jgi:hypothetical protein